MSGTSTESPSLVQAAKSRGMQHTNLNAIVMAYRRSVGAGTTTTVLFTVISLALCSSPMAEQPKGELRPGNSLKQTILSDDFKSDSRSQYTITGNVEWESNALALQAGAGVATKIQAVKVVQLSLNLKFPPPPRSGDEVVAEIGFELDNGESLTVVLLQRIEEDKLVGEVRVMKCLTPVELAKGNQVSGQAADSKPEVEEVRRFRLPGGLPHGSWDIANCYRLISIDVAGHEHLVTYLEGEPSMVAGFFLRCKSAPVQLTNMLVQVEPVATLTKEQEQRLADGRRLCLQREALSSKGSYRDAIPLGEMAVQLLKDAFGVGHPDYAESMNDLAFLYLEQSDYEKAEPLFRQACDVWRQSLGEDHPHYAVGLNNLGMLCEGQQNYAAAEKLYRQAAEIRKRAFGEDHPQFARSLNNLASLRHSQGLYAEAGILYRQAGDIFKRAFGEEDSEYAGIVNNLAVLYQDEGDYAKAESLYVQASEIMKHAFGEGHPSYARSLSNLAVLYHYQCEYEKAETVAQRALEIRKQVLGENHPNYATSLNNLALLYQDEGDYAKAEPLIREANDIWRRVLGENHQDFAIGLQTLARLYLLQGEYAKTEPLLRQILEIRKQTLGENHPDYARVVNSLAVLYGMQGDYEKAEPLFRQAVEIRKRALSENHPDYASSVSSLAQVYQLKREYAKAEPLLRHALEIRRQVLGGNHPDYAQSVLNLALLRKEQGDLANAELLAREAWQIEHDFVVRMILFLPEAKAAALRQRLSGCDPLLDVLRNRPETSPSDAYSVLWSSRAMMSRSLSQRWRIIASTPEAQDLLRDLQGTVQQLAQTTLAVTKPEQREKRQKRLVELNERKEVLEKELARVSIEFARSRQVSETKPEDLARVLPKDTAVVEFYRSRNWKSRIGQVGSMPGEANYSYDVFVLRPNESQSGIYTAWIQLGPAKLLDEAVMTWRARITGQPDVFSQEQGQATFKLPIVRESERTTPVPPDPLLREHFWDKIETHLAGCSTVLVVPDGDLCFMPWAALPGRNPETCLLEDYAIATVPSAQQLCATLTEQQSVAGSLLVVGGVQYDCQPAPLASQDVVLAMSSTAERTRAPAKTGLGQWQPLPGTVEEVETIVGLWPGKSGHLVLQMQTASEAALRRQLPGNCYVHLATHGFFADEKFRSMYGHDVIGEQIFGDIGAGVTARQAQVTIRNPLILSGIVLAGANLPPKTDELDLPTGEDGILTAEEIVNLDLVGTQLVVLSACDTSLGSVAGGEGVMGLTRAFHLAGAQNVIASLWKVDDQATLALMRLFYYKLWKENKSPTVALREAQLYLYRNPGEIRAAATSRGFDVSKTAPLPEGGRTVPGPSTAPPRLWAAFILSGPGEWAKPTKSASGAGHSFAP